MTLPQLLNAPDDRGGLPSIQLLKCSLGRLGCDDDLLTVHALQAALEQEIQRQLAKLLKNQGGFVIEQPTTRANAIFRYQKFFSEGILERHARNYVTAVAESILPFVSYETARRADIRDIFARIIFINYI